MGYVIVGALVLSGIIQLSIGIYAIVQSNRGKNLWFSCLAIAASVYSFGYAFELTAQTVLEALVYLRIEYLGIAFLPTFGLLTALEFTGKRWIPRSKPAIAMLAFSALTLVGMHTTDLHHLYYANLLLTKVGALTIIQITRGPWYMASMTYANLATVAGTTVVARSMITAPADLKAGRRLFLAGFVLMGLSSNACAAGLSPYGVDLTPYGFMIMNVLLLIGLRPGQVFDLVSIAKSRVFDGMDDIVVIIDRSNRVAGYNPALHQIIPERGRDYVGEPFLAVFDKHPEIAEFATTHCDGETDIALNDDTSRVFRARIHTVGQNSRRSGTRVLAKYLTMTNITKEMTMVRAMKDLADLDELTGIANRRSFYDQIEQLIGGQRAGCPISVIMLDIDHFKAVNDTYGHKAGDIVLQKVASLLSQNTRAQDILARYGGEEFILAIPDMGAGGAVALAERLRTSINAFEEIYDGQSIEVTASFGVACDIAGPGFDIESLIKKADTALYEAKSSGRDTVAFSAAESNPAVYVQIDHHSSAVR